MVKTPTDWSPNVSAEANQKTYSSALTTYNSPVTTYSTIVPGDQSDSDKVPTAWSAA